MAKKSSASEKKTPKKTVPAMFPKPERVTYRSDDPNVDIEAMLAGLDVESRRMDFEGRLESYAAMLSEIVLPHFGDHQERFTAEQWAEVRRQWPHLEPEPPQLELRALPASAPSEAWDAFNALRSINHIRREMMAVTGQPDAAQRAVCWAIDLGLLLQRVQAQLYFGPTVALGRGNALARDKANSTKTMTKGERVAKVKTEYLKRKDGSNKLSKTSILKSMSQVYHTEYEKGQPVKVRTYGSYGQLARDSKGW